MKPTCVELFAGAGGASVGLHRAGFHSLLAVEWDKDAHATLAASGTSDRAVCGDVRDPALYEDLVDKVDLLWASPPCFPPGSPVVTSEGLRGIDSICEGDLVLTHKGRYRRVLKKMERAYQGDLVQVLVGYGRGEIQCTPEHPFYVRRFLHHRSHKDVFGEPEWIEAREIHPKDLVLEPRVNEPISYVPSTYHKNLSLGGRWGSPERERRVYPCKINVLAPGIADILGLYLSEGHLRGHDAERPGPNRREVVLSIARHEIGDVRTRIEEAGFHPTVDPEHSPGAARVTITSTDLWALCREFGCGAENKVLPEWVFGMTQEWRLQLLGSYFKGDGSNEQQSRSVARYWRASTISLALVSGMLRLITCSMEVVGSGSVLYDSHEGTIEGRSVHMRRAYGIRYAPPGKARPAKVVLEGGWIPVRAVSTTVYAGIVHNIEVDEDNSYTVNTLAVHNCQAWSTSGKRLGAFDDRNGWPWTFDIIKLVKPRWVLCENVTGMKYHREGCTAEKHQADVHGEGTTLGIFGDGGEDTISPPEDCPGCYWERVVLPWFKANFGFSAWCVVNSANYGTPQKRERVILMAGPKHPIGWGDPWPTETHSLQELVGTKNDGRYWARHGIKPSDQRSKKERKEGSPGISETESKRGALPWLTVRDAFSMLPPEVNGYESLWVQPHQVARTEAFRSTTDIAMNPDMPSDTVTCRRGGAKTNDALIWNHDGRLRYLTLAEVASLQAFPPDHPWQGSKSAKYKQVGNAVPPPVAEALGRVIVSALK